MPKHHFDQKFSRILLKEEGSRFVRNPANLLWAPASQRTWDIGMYSNRETLR